MSKFDEDSYIQGSRAAWLEILRMCLRGLGYNSDNTLEVEAVSRITEREEAIAVLRRLCDDFGDNEWEPSLNLADIIDKHLGRYLYEEGEDGQSKASD